MAGVQAAAAVPATVQETETLAVTVPTGQQKVPRSRMNLGAIPTVVFNGAREGELPSLLYLWLLVKATSVPFLLPATLC